MELENRAGLEMSPQQNLPTCIASFSMIPQQAMQPAHVVQQQQPLYPNLAHGQVMTDKQLETLRRQISVYATICQQLVEMHKAMMAQQSSASGLWLDPSLPFDPSLHHMGHKLTSRQRWTPSQAQLHILERLFEQENGTPNKQRIKEITIELSLHGQISETNVYNWFQNRRARTKRKQQLGGPNNGDSELETDTELPEEKKGKTKKGGFSNDSFNCAQFGDGSSRGSRVGISEWSLVQANADSYTVAVNKASLNGHGNELETSHLAEHKLWDLPMGVCESKVDFGGLSASEEFQGRQMVMSGALSHH